MMRIVIEISDAYYNAIKQIPCRYCSPDMLLIKTGTPLPKERRMTNAEKFKDVFGFELNTDAFKNYCLAQFVDGECAKHSECGTCPYDTYGWAESEYKPNGGENHEQTDNL